MPTTLMRSIDAVDGIDPGCNELDNYRQLPDRALAVVARSGQRRSATLSIAAAMAMPIV